MAAGAATGLAASGWIAALAPIAAPAVVGALGGVAIMGSVISAMDRLSNRRKKKLVDDVSKSLEYGLDTFVNVLAKSFGRIQTADMSVDGAEDLARAYSSIVDPDTMKLRLNKVDKSKIKTMVGGILTKDQKKEIGQSGVSTSPLDGDVKTGAMGNVLKKFAKLILFSNVGKVNESREQDKKAMLRFLKSYKKTRGRDYESILKNKFDQKERDGLVWWFSDSKRGKQFIKTYLDDASNLFDGRAVELFSNSVEQTIVQAGGRMPDEGSDEGGEASDESGSAVDLGSTVEDSMDFDMSNLEEGLASHFSNTNKNKKESLEKALEPIIFEVIKEILEK